MKNLAINLKKIRKKWGYQQAHFAELFENSNRGKIATYESRSLPDLNFMVRLEELSKIPMYAICTRELLNDEIPNFPNLDKYDPLKKSVVQEGSIEERLQQMEKRLRDLEEKK